MAKTLGSVTTLVRQRIQELTPSYWTEAEVAAAINIAKDDLGREISRINEDFFQENITLSFAVGDIREALPLGFLRLKNLRTTTSGFESQRWIPMDQANPQFVDGLASTNVSITRADSEMYDIMSDITTDRSYLMVSPIVGSAMDVSCDYISYVPDLSGTNDTFKILDPFVGFIEDMATFYLLCKGPAGDFATWKRLADQKLQTILVDAARRQIKDAEFAQGYLEDDY
jgi:hypothetical protein